ncbi:hypothetical protein ACFL96_15970 [Thermoproteota archaeon]
MNRKILIRLFSSTVVLTFLVSLVFPGSLLLAEEVSKDTPEVERAEELMLTSHILSLEETEELSGLLSEIIKQTKDVETLTRISLGVTEKVVSDRANLQFILVDLDKLAVDKYSANLGGVKSSQLKSCLDKVEKLSIDMEKMRPKIDKPDKELELSDYIKIMNANSVFLTGGKKIQTVLDVWIAIKAQITQPLPLWEKRYQELLLKLKTEEGNKAPEDVLNDDELKFIKTFGRLVVYYHKLSGSLGELWS